MMKNYSLKCTFVLFVAFVMFSNAAVINAAEGVATVLNGKVISPVTRAKALPFNAIVEEVLVVPGQNVLENQIVMTYSLTEEAERALHKELTAGDGTEANRSQLLSLQRELANIVTERNKARKLAAAGLGSNQAFARMEGDVKSLEQRIKLIEQTIEKQEANYKRRIDELSGYFGETITGIADLPEKLVLIAPIDGHVLSVATGLYPGKQLGAGGAPILVGKLDPMLIQVELYEDDMGSIEVGDVARVTIPSLQDKEIEATVAKIAWTSNDVKVGTPSYYTVELTVPNPNLELKPGFKATIQFNKK